MSVDLMLGMIRDQGSRRQLEQARQYRRSGNDDGVRAIYRRIVGNV